jgi:hypothetical protein
MAQRAGCLALRVDRGENVLSKTVRGACAVFSRCASSTCAGTRRTEGLGRDAQRRGDSRCSSSGYDAVHTVAAGGCVLDPRVVARMLGNRRRAIDTLTTANVRFSA